MPGGSGAGLPGMPGGVTLLPPPPPPPPPRVEPSTILPPTKPEDGSP